MREERHCLFSMTGFPSTDSSVREIMTEELQRVVDRDTKIIQDKGGTVVERRDPEFTDFDDGTVGAVGRVTLIVEMPDAA